MRVSRCRRLVSVQHMKKAPVGVSRGGLAAEEGFEPSLTEPESGVLPLHYSAVQQTRV